MAPALQSGSVSWAPDRRCPVLHTLLLRLARARTDHLPPTGFARREVRADDVRVEFEVMAV